MFYTGHLLIVDRFLKNCLNHGPVYSRYFITVNTKFRLKNNPPIEKYLRIVDTRWKYILFSLCFIIENNLFQTFISNISLFQTFFQTGSVRYSLYASATNLLSSVDPGTNMSHGFLVHNPHHSLYVLAWLQNINNSKVNTERRFW